MTTQQEKQGQQRADSAQTSSQSGQADDPGYRPGGSHPGGSPGTVEGGSGLPTQGGDKQSGLAGQAGTQPGGGNPSVAKEQTNRPAESSEDQNAG